MRRPLLLLVCGMVLAARSVSAAQIFEIPVSAVLDLDPSMRSYAMASATGAVFWGKDPNHWRNPALLGYAEGIRYDDALVDLGSFTIGTPGLEETIHFRETARGETIGYGGLGVALVGQPFEGLGGRTLELGDFQDQARSWRVGISLARIAQSVLPGRGAGITRHFDLAFGYGQTTVEGESISDAVCWDWGLLARGGTEFTVYGVPAQVEGAYGYSFLNRGDDQVLGNQRELNSAGLHIAAARLPDGFAGFPAWLRTGFEPLVSIGGGFSADYHPWNAQHLEAWGGELGVANVLFLRQGWRSGGGLSTWGFGVGLPVGSFGGVRYDQAYLEDIDFDYRAWSVWIDPVAIARAGR
jgi:hypothetical protein